MTSKSYRARVVVLKKTKLREKDLILTMLDESGMLRQAVAKGARRPGGSFAARLELFSVVDGWFVEGKSLDVVTDAKFSSDHPLCTFDLEQAACASAVAELVCSVAQEGLAYERLFDMTVLAFAVISRCDPATAVAICAAAQLKTVAMAGFRPSFEACVICGKPIGLNNQVGKVRLSIVDGGAVCGSCRNVPDAVQYEIGAVAWARALLTSTFADIELRHPDVSTSFELLQFVRQWVHVHVGKSLKSIDYILSCGLF